MFFFNIFASFLAFSASSQKNLNFQRSSECIRDDVDKKNSKKQEKSNLQKKKVEGPMLRPKQHFAYK
jgi:hypothetical protein